VASIYQLSYEFENRGFQRNMIS